MLKNYSLLKFETMALKNKKNKIKGEIITQESIAILVNFI